jgi:SAM-dependent methyltransferase
MSSFDVQKYWEDRLQKSFGLHGVGFVGMGRYYNNWLYKIRRRVFINYIKKNGGNFSKSIALDIGCGSGFYIERWKELGVNSIVGIDITKVAVDEMRVQHPECKFFKMDIGKDVKPISEMKFDFISAFDVLFHIVDDTEFENSIHNIYSLLKPGGLFLWSDNFLHGQTQRSSHQVCRSLANIETVLNRAHFQIIQRRPMFYLMNGPIDRPNIGHKILWKHLKSAVKKSEIAGACFGGLLYPIELLLITFAKESPTTEIMICKRD